MASTVHRITAEAVEQTLPSGLVMEGLPMNVCRNGRAQCVGRVVLSLLAWQVGQNALVAQDAGPAPKSATQTAAVGVVKPLKIDRFTNQDLDQDFGTLPGNNLTSLPRGK